MTFERVRHQTVHAAVNLLSPRLATRGIGVVWLPQDLEPDATGNSRH